MDESTRACTAAVCTNLSAESGWGERERETTMDESAGLHGSCMHQFVSGIRVG
jgi:hypothetical protein